MPPGMPLGPKPGTLAPGLNPEGPKLGGVAPAGKGGGRSGLGCGGVKKEGLPPAVGRVAPKAGLLPLGSGGGGSGGGGPPAGTGGGSPTPTGNWLSFLGSAWTTSDPHSPRRAAVNARAAANARRPRAPSR